MQFFAYFVKDIVGIVRIRIGNIVLGILVLPRGDLPGGSAVSIGLIGIILLEDRIAVVFNVPVGQTAVAVIAEHLACHAVTDLGEPVILIVGVGVDMGAAGYTGRRGYCPAFCFLLCFLRTTRMTTLETATDNAVTTVFQTEKPVPGKDKSVSFSVPFSRVSSV